ncbi:MAG: polyketide antibiotic transporter [Actinomycetota bacterium]|nr:polyketide antibiotic transporter [Actinomycetota bacterium]
MALRLIRRGTLMVLVVLASLSGPVAWQFRRTLAATFDPDSLRALAENPALRALYGPPGPLADPGGFTVWRTGMFAAVVLGVWSLMTATRITRGEEEAGRWALLLAARIRLPGLVGRHLCALVVADVLIGGAVVGAMLLARTQVRGSLLFGAGLALVGMVFAGVGTLAGQLFPSRRLAAGAAGGVLGVALLLRMAADGASGLSWLHWGTPFGLFAAVEPYGADRVLPLAVLAGMGLVVGLVSVGAGWRRDLGAGWIPVRDRRRPRTLLLRRLGLFSLRRTLRGLIGWAVGVAAYFLLIGALAKTLTKFLAGSPRYAEMAAQAGFRGLATVEGYAAALLVLLAIPIGVYAAGRIGLTAADEGEGRMALLLSLPVSRLRWAGLEAGVTAVACSGLAAVAGLALWAGTLLAGAPLGVGPSLAGAFNVLPVGLLCLGAAVLALGWAPRLAVPVGSLPATGGFLLLVLADSFGWPAWVRQISPFAHVASVPSVPPDWPGTAGILGVAVLLAAVGGYGYSRRDLRG